MQRSPTLYKIQRPAADSKTHAIVVDTTKAPSTTQPHILFCGGFHSSMHGNKAQFLSELCAQKGWGFTRFDYQGHGQSDGEFEYCSLHDWLGDALAVFDDVVRKAQVTRLVLVGSSMGAWLSTHVLLKRATQVAALVGIAAAPDFTERLLWPALSTEQQARISNGDIIGVPSHYDELDWRLGSALFDSGRELALLNNCNPIKADIPIRLLHGTADTDVPWEFSELLLRKFENASNASLLLLRGADHRLSDELSLKKLSASIIQVAELLT